MPESFPDVTMADERRRSTDQGTGDHTSRVALIERSILVRRFRNNGPMGSGCIIDFVAPSVDDGLAIDVGDKGHQAFPEFVFGADADVAQHRTRQLGEEALNEIEP